MVKIAAALGVFFGYPIQFFIMIRIIWPNIKQNSTNAQKYPITIQVVLRFFMVLCTCKYFFFFDFTIFRYRVCFFNQDFEAKSSLPYLIGLYNPLARITT